MNFITRNLSATIVTTACLAAAGLGAALPTDRGWWETAPATVAVTQTATVTPVAAGSSAKVKKVTRWSERAEGYKVYKSYFGVNNGCRNDFELSYGGIVKKSKLTKAQKRDNEIIPSKKRKGYVHLIESEAQEACYS